ncbi:hypothetical protein [Streptomyces sp. NPDC055140]
MLDLVVAGAGGDGVGDEGAAVEVLADPGEQLEAGVGDVDDAFVEAAVQVAEAAPVVAQGAARARRPSQPPPRTRIPGAG